MTYLLYSINLGLREKALLIQNYHGDTAVHLAVKESKMKTVSAILESVTPESRQNILKVFTSLPKYGGTALHLAASQDNVAMIRAILDALPAKMQEQLIALPDNNGENAKQLAHNRNCRMAYHVLADRMPTSIASDAEPQSQGMQHMFCFYSI